MRKKEKENVSAAKSRAYDGDVTATIDPLDNVTASSYDEFGAQTAAYQGQIITNTVPRAETFN